MKRIMCAVPLLALALTGCGGDGPTTATAPTAGASSASARPIPAGGYADVNALVAALTKAGVNCTLAQSGQDAYGSTGRCNATGGSADLTVVADPSTITGKATLEQSAAGA